MVLIKALLAGLTGVSLCMANISGIVTDTGTTPIAGAIVQLEKCDQSATTGADGSFMLIVKNTGILPGSGKLLPNGLSAGISGSLMTMTIAERAAVEVATFDLTGKALSTVRKTMDAGSHSILIPYQRAGIYLYTVKSGNSEFVIKGNSIGDISYGSSVTTQGSSPKLLAKQAKVMAAMNDVLAAMKTGYLNYRCVQYNFDTTGIKIKMIASAGTVTDTDGNVYQTVKIGNQVWMTENLRVTKYNDGSTIRLETSDITWGNVAMPKYCFYNNTTNSDSIKKYGPLYSWHVVSPTNPKKIAPTGWHVPSEAEWDTLQNYLIAKGYNWDGTTTGDKIGKSLAANTDWDTYMTTLGTPGYDLTKNNSAGFSALPGGYRDGNGFFNQQSYLGNWWSVTEVDATGAWSRILVFGLIELGRVISNKINGISVRLVRD